MGKVGKNVTCSMPNCSNPAVRSMSRERMVEAGMETASGDRRAYLCQNHYKEWKKATKRDRAFERARYG